MFVQHQSPEVSQRAMAQLEDFTSLLALQQLTGKIHFTVFPTMSQYAHMFTHQLQKPMLFSAFLFPPSSQSINPYYTHIPPFPFYPLQLNCTGIHLVNIYPQLPQICPRKLNLAHQLLMCSRHIVECEDAPAEFEEEIGAEGDEGPEW